MSSKSIIDQAKLASWASMFSDQKTSGLSVAEWCLQNNISKNRFFYWKRKLKDEVITSNLPDIVPLSMTPSKSPSNELSNLQTTRESCTSCATFQTSCARVYINGMTVEFDASASDALIRSVLKAVRHV
jgi:hypothetical protein